MVQVHSKYNSRVKYIKKLGRRRARDREGKFVVEGLRAVQDMLQAGAPVEFILYSTRAAPELQEAGLLEAAGQQGVELVEAGEDILQDAAYTENPQGIIAVAGRVEKTLEEIFARQPDLLVIVDGVQDPGNLGTIIRTSAGAGAGGVILLPGTADAYNPKTVRSTAGNLAMLPVFTARRREEVLEKLQWEKFRVIAGEAGAGEPVFNLDLTAPVAIAVGSEARGIQQDVSDLCWHKVHIPLCGDVESLNVAVAAGIILYEVVRQRYSQ